MDIQLDIFDVQAIAAYVMADCPPDITNAWVDIDCSHFIALGWRQARLLDAMTMPARGW